MRPHSARSNRITRSYTSDVVLYRTHPVLCHIFHPPRYNEIPRRWRWTRSPCDHIVLARSSWQLMPDEFKVVIAGLFELARDKNSQIPSAADNEGVNHQPEGPPGEPLSSDRPDGGAGTREGDGETGVEQAPASRSGVGRKIDSAGGGGAGAAATSEVPTQGTPTPNAKTEAQLVQNGESQGQDPASLDAGEGSTNTTAAAEAVEAAPDWLADPKAFLSRVIQWAGEGSAKRSKVVHPKPPTREMPKLLASSLLL